MHDRDEPIVVMPLDVLAIRYNPQSMQPTRRMFEVYRSALLPRSSPWCPFSSSSGRLTSGIGCVRAVAGNTVADDEVVVEVHRLCGRR
jgi:hypothetical protein